MGSYLWKNEHFDYIESFIGVQENLFDTKGSGIVFRLSTKQTARCWIQKRGHDENFRELGHMMNPPEELVKQSIEDYKQKKLSL